MKSYTELPGYDRKRAEKLATTTKRHASGRVPAGLGQFRGGRLMIVWAREGMTNGRKDHPKASGITLRFSQSRRDRRYQKSTAGQRAYRKALRESEADDD